LRALVKHKNRNWDEFLHFATFSFNTSFNARIGHTPHFVDHGYEANLPGKLPMFLLNQESKVNIPQDISPYCNDLFSKTQLCHQLVQSNLETANEKHSKIEDMPEFFEVNEFVWLFNPVRHVGVHPSFKTFWEGPFEVLSKKSSSFQNSRSWKTIKHSNSLCSQTQTMFHITIDWGKMLGNSAFPNFLWASGEGSGKFCS
jgi:hypothetical protein